MATILGIGIATLDIINTTEGYPPEDSEVRALTQALRRGGNIANTLTVLSQLGHRCEWAGTLADDADSRFIEAELRRFHIGIHRCALIPGGHAPTSYITLNQHNGSRTIVHYRDLPEFGFDRFLAAVQKYPLDDVDWLHAEGRNVPETVKMLDYVRQRYPRITLSLEIEKPRDGIEVLYACGCDVVFFSRHFANASQYQGAAEFLRAWRPKCAAHLLVCPWGQEGAYALEREGLLHFAPAVQIPRVVDTIGAGDTFNAGFIHSALQRLPVPQRLSYANALAGKKCSQAGLERLNLTQ